MRQPLFGEALEHRIVVGRFFRDILDEIRPGDVFVFNNTKVIPARLYGKKRDTGGKVEMLAQLSRQSH